MELKGDASFRFDLSTGTSDEAFSDWPVLTLVEKVLLPNWLRAAKRGDQAASAFFALAPDWGAQPRL